MHSVLLLLSQWWAVSSKGWYLVLFTHTWSSSHTPGAPHAHLQLLTHTWRSSNTSGAPHTHLEFLTHTWSSSHPSGTVPRQVFAMDGHKPEALRSTSATHGHVSTAGEISQLKEWRAELKNLNNSKNREKENAKGNEQVLVSKGDTMASAPRLSGLQWGTHWTTKRHVKNLAFCYSR